MSVISYAVLALLTYDDTFLEHDTGPGHPESPGRLRAIVSHLTDTGLWGRLEHLPARPATREELCLAHDPEHVDLVLTVGGERGAFDPDTVFGPRSLDAALLACGGALEVVDEVMRGEERRGFCLVRPPGHHATRRRSMGFCLVNNLAVCARHLVREHGLRRVAIVDFDVHHGNGTEDVFREDDSVFYLSLHRYPFYPGTGGPPGYGPVAVANRNVPLSADTKPEEYHAAFTRALGEVEDFAPEFVLVSAGFDAHRDDPVGGLGLLAEDYGTLTDRLVALAERTADGRVVAALEGGYNLRVLGDCVRAHLLALDPENSAYGA